jgi:hypothetical protein
MEQTALEVAIVFFIRGSLLNRDDGPAVAIAEWAVVTRVSLVTDTPRL